jgi:hypothetical protein
MIRFLFVFVVLAVLIHFGITAWQKMSGTERWTLTKTAIYSILVALLAIVAMMFLVVLF